MLGTFFAADVHRGGDAPADPWRPVRELVDVPQTLDDRVSRVRKALARNGSPESVELRVAASVTQLGLVARLVAPTIAIAALEIGHPDPNNWWWQDELGGPFPLSMALSGQRGGGYVDGVVASLTTAIATNFGVPARTVWGNLASATNGAVQMIARTRPDLGPRASVVADVILADPRVEGGNLRAGPSFRRTSCCLIYRLEPANSPVCGDCVLHR